MKQTSSFFLLLGIFAFSQQQIDAHLHAYIVEQPVPAYVVVQPVAPAYVVAQTAPPVEVVEEMGVSPGPNYYYINGHKEWDGCRWHHVHGHWALRY